MIPYIQFPRYFKFIGLLFYISGFAISFYFQPNTLDSTNGMSLLIQVLVLLGLLLICCAKQTYEDEFIQHCRLKSLQWAVLLFVLLRVLFKIMVWITQDVAWTPNFQVNALLQIYLMIFYYQVFLKDFFLNLFNTKRS